jgi:hypothetical protein
MTSVPTLSFLVTKEGGKKQAPGEKQTGKGNNAFENSRGFQAQIDDLPLKYSILAENAETKSSGRTIA